MITKHDAIMHSCLGRWRASVWFFQLCALAAALSPYAYGQTAAHVVNAVPTALPPIVVHSALAPRKLLDTPASVGRLDGSALHTGKPGLDLAESLPAIPGIQAQNRHNAAQELQVSIRGFGARSTFGIRGIRIYIDDIPATMPDGQGQLTSIDLPSMQDVEVLSGPYSALYGNSSGGVLRMRSAPGEGRAQLHASFLSGSFGLRRYGVQFSGATQTGTLTDYRLSVNRTFLDGYREHSASRKTLANARLGFALGDSTLTLHASHVNLYADDPLGLNATDFRDRPRSVVANALTYNTRKTVKQTQLGLNWTTDLNADHQVQIITYGGQRDTVQFQAIPYIPQRNFDTHAGGVIDLKRAYHGVDIRWTARATWADTNFTVVSGLAYDHMRETRRGFENFIGTATPPTHLGVQGRLRRDERNTLENLDPYLQATFDLTPQWSLEGGLRYSTVRFQSKDRYLFGANGDDSGRAKYQAWLPVLALRYAVSDETAVYVTAGRGFETPTFNELSYRPGMLPGLNFDLQPSRSRNLETGFKTEAFGGLLTGAVFHIDTHNEIVSAGAMGGRTTFRNAGKSRRQGLELAWSGTFATHGRVQTSATWLRAHLRNPQGGEGRVIPGVARQSAYASLAWAPPQGWQAGTQWRVLSRIHANSANTATSAGYAVAGAFVGFKTVLSGWELNSVARVDNLFDRHYAGSVIVNENNLRFYEPAAGRNWTVSLSATFRF